MSIIVATACSAAVLARSPGSTAWAEPVIQQDVNLKRDDRDVIIRGDAASRRVAILIHVDLSPQAIDRVLSALTERSIPASFFFTRSQLTDANAGKALEQLRMAGHYIGLIVDKSHLETLESLRAFGFAAAGASTFGLVSADASDGVAEECRKVDVEVVGPTPGIDARASNGGKRGDLNGVLMLLDLRRSLPADAAQVDSQLPEIVQGILEADYEPVRIDQLAATAMRPTPRDPNYPPHWWIPVSAAGAPAWEILPQAAGPGEVILSKRHELGLLSNFAATPFSFRGQNYASLEGFWQCMKYPEDAADPRATIEWPASREEVAALTAFEAKAAGDLGSKNMSSMGIDWVSFEGRRFPYKPAEPGEHYALIVAATRAKVEQNVEVQRVLLATGDLVLKPDHHQAADAPAAWRYFEILTEIRRQLRAAQGESASEHPDRR